jgi:membrane protein DedA with SNARE-associated domain
VSWLPHEQLQHFISTHGYWAVALIVGLESMGLPLPGETILVLGRSTLQQLLMLMSGS